MDENVLESLSTDNNSDVSLLEELERWYNVDNGDEDQGSRADAPAPSNNNNDEGPRQMRLRKHRESMSRLRQDRRNRIKQLEQHEQSLQQRLHRALVWMDLHREAHDVYDCQRLAYSDLVRAADGLMLQKYALEEELLQRQRYVKLLTSGMSRLEEESRSIITSTTSIGSPDSAGTTTTIDGYWVRFCDDEPPLYYAYEQPETCGCAINVAVDTLASTRRRIANADSSLSIAHCFGWRTEWLIDNPEEGSDLRPVLHFRFTRRVARLRTSLQELLDKTWTVLQTQSQSCQVYGYTVVVKHMQKISDDAFIHLQNLPVRENHTRLRCFGLVSRMQAIDGDSAAIVMSALNKQPRQSELEMNHGVDPADTIDWLNLGTTTLQFSHADDDAIEVEYVGTVECLDSDHAAHLAIECCAALLRWEHLVLQPRLLC